MPLRTRQHPCWQSCGGMTTERLYNTLQVSKYIRKIFLLTALVLMSLLLMAADRSEAASINNELSYFKEEILTDPKTGAEIYRLEYGVSTPEVQFTQKQVKKKPRQLLITFKKTKLGKIEREQELDGRYASDITFNDEKPGKVQVTVNFAGEVKKQGYKLYYAKPDKLTKKPGRLVMEIQKRGSLGRDVDISGLKGRTIVIDPGHGGTDQGASGPSGAKEKIVTLYVSQALRNILTDAGAKVVMTREDDRDVYGPDATDRQELDARVDVARRTKKADVFLSIHCDAFSNPKPNGTGTFVYGKFAEDYTLGQALQDGMLRRGGRRDRSVREANFYVIKHSPVPSALVELAFITNYKEELLLCSDGFQQDMAIGLAEGLAEFLRDYKGSKRSYKEDSELSPRQRREKKRQEKAADGSKSKEERRRK